jgi:hypothetical protein
MKGARINLSVDYVGSSGEANVIHQPILSTAIPIGWDDPCARRR